VGLFNRGQSDTRVTATWAALGVSGRQVARDLWVQKDLGDREGIFEATVPHRGVIMLRLQAAN
jgi:alpha-galactosidase